MNNVILSNTSAQKISKTWEDKISSIPTRHLFENGTHRPIMMDIMFANQSFAPHHNDEPEKNGKEYSITESALETCGKQFIGTPVYLYDRTVADHGMGKDSRKSIGFIHDVILTKSAEKGSFLQALAGIMPMDVDLPDLETNQEDIGVSPEFGIDDTAVGVTGAIAKFLPRGVLILNKQNAAFKNSQLYCSDAAPKTEAEKKPVAKQSNQNKVGGVHMFCDKCAPLADNEIQKLLASKIKDFEERAKQFKTVEDMKAQTELAAAEAKSNAKKLEDEVAALKASISEKEAKIDESNKKALEFIAAADVNKQFETRKTDYAVEKHDDVKRILLKIKLGQATSDEVLNLADWKVVGKGEDKTKMSIAGAGKDDKTVVSNEDIDRILGLAGSYGYKSQVAK